MSEQVAVEEILSMFRQFLEERRRLSKPIERGGPPLSSAHIVGTYYVMARRFLRDM